MKIKHGSIGYIHKRVLSTILLLYTDNLQLNLSTRKDSILVYVKFYPLVGAIEKEYIYSQFDFL